MDSEKSEARYSKAPDDDVFINLAKTYSFSHAKMHLEPGCDSESGFKNGITNGAEWYPVTGRFYNMYHCSRDDDVTKFCI